MEPVVHVEKFYQDHIWLTQTYAMDVGTVDAWEVVIRDYIQYINSPRRYLVIDLTAIPRPGLTFYMNKRVTAIAQENREASGRVGIALTLNPMVRYIFEPFIGFISSQFQPGLKVQLFAEREAALNWVAEALPPEIKAAGA